MSRFRVLVVTNLWPYEGDPSYGCFVQAQMESLEPLGVEYSVLFINGRRGKAAYWRSVPELWKTVRTGGFNLVHAHMGLAGCVARCQFRLPLVVSFLGNDVLGKRTRVGRLTVYDRFLRASSYILAHNAGAVIVQSDEMKRQLRLPSAHVIPNGIDLELFRPTDQAEARRDLGLAPERKLVLFPYDPKRGEKRYDVALAAVERVRKTFSDVELRCVYGVPQDKVPLYMNAADVLVLASQLEGSPNTVKEAMAVNLPVVTVDVGDTSALLRQTEGNYLVARDPEAMAAGIVEVLRSGKRSRSREPMKRLSMEATAKQVVGVYEAVLAAMPPA